MELKIITDKFDVIKERITSGNKQIIIFGAGMIGTVTSLELIKEMELESRVEFYVDNDINKQGTCVTVGNRSVCIYSVKRLEDISACDYIIFLATSRFSDTINQLEGYHNLKEAECYIVPALCVKNFKPRPSGPDKNASTDINPHYDEIVADTGKRIPLIPKVINYMWLGGKKLPKALQGCVDSWKKYCPDYEIISYDENNYDIDKIPYMKEAYHNGAYGFVPDYARLDILYSHGGIYLDTDVELIKGIDDLLYEEGFCCVEKWQTINFGGGSGAIKGLPIIGELLKYRAAIPFIDEKGSLNRTTCGYYDTKFLLEHGYKINGKKQKIKGLTVLPYEYFHPYDYASGLTDITENTCGIHHFGGSWLDESMEQANRETRMIYNELFKENI